ncbi:hypothetical protein BHE74_00009935, partial [Ensete ventricosum]
FFAFVLPHGSRWRVCRTAEVSGTLTPWTALHHHHHHHLLLLLLTCSHRVTFVWELLGFDGAPDMDSQGLYPLRRLQEESKEGSSEYGRYVTPETTSMSLDSIVGLLCFPRLLPDKLNLPGFLQGFSDESANACGIM